MSIGTDLNYLEQVLRALLLAFEHESWKKWGESKRPQVGDPDYPTFMSELEKLQGQLEWITRGLQRIESRIEGEANRGRKYMQSRGYGYAATLKQQSTRTEQLHSLATTLYNRVIDILRDDFGASIVESAHELGDGANDYLHALKILKASSERPTNGPIFVPAASHLDTLTPLITFLSFLLGMALKRRKERETKK